MKNVTILALEGAMASTVTDPMDIFSQAGVCRQTDIGFVIHPRTAHAFVFT